MVSDPPWPAMIHTSCRSESSNISLVVLDKDSMSQKWPLTQKIFDNRFPDPAMKWSLEICNSQFYLCICPFTRETWTRNKLCHQDLWNIMPISCNSTWVSYIFMKKYQTIFPLVVKFGISFISLSLSHLCSLSLSIFFFQSNNNSIWREFTIIDTQRVAKNLIFPFKSF